MNQNFQVGLALVVEGEMVLGVMGCPNWQKDKPGNSATETLNSPKTLSGIIMVAHVGCGTWTKQLSFMLGSTTEISNSWTRCSVDRCWLVHEARFCCSDSQTWESLPLSTLFDATTDAESINDKQILLLSACCGRFDFPPFVEAQLLTIGIYLKIRLLSAINYNMLL